MSNTFTGKVSGRMSSRGWAIALGIGADRARCDPARRLPRSLPRPCRRQERPDAGARREAAHPDGNARLARRDRARCTRRRRSRARKSRSERSPIRRTSRGRAAAVGHLPGPADHRDGLRGERHRLGRLADHGHAARDLDLDRQRPRQSLSQVQAGDSVDIYTAVAGVVKLFRAERQGARRSRTIPGPSGGVEPRPPHRDEGRGERGPTRPTTRSSSSSSARSSARSRRSRRRRTRLRC